VVDSSDPCGSYHKRVAHPLRRSSSEKIQKYQWYAYPVCVRLILWSGGLTNVAGRQLRAPVNPGGTFRTKVCKGVEIEENNRNCEYFGAVTAH